MDDDGNLRIRGGVIEQNIAAIPTGTLMIYDPVTEILRVNYRSGPDASTVAFTAEGDLLTNVPIIEQATITEPGPDGVGVMRPACTVLGGTASTTAVLKLDLTAVRIRGIITTHQIL